MTHPPFVEFGCSTFTTLQLSSGVHFIQVSKWLGHSTFTLTSMCTATGSRKMTCGAVNPSEPTVTTKAAEKPNNVVSLFG